MYSVVLMMAMTTGAETPDFGRRNGCHGGGGCYGGYSGCSGSGYGGYSGCSGSGYGGYSGCSGSGYGGYSGYGGCSGGYYGGYSGCSGSYYGGYSGCSGGVIYGSPYAPGGLRTMPGAEGVKPKLEEKPNLPKPELEIAAPAQLIVTLPAGARLLIDDTATAARPETTRTFETPALAPGRDYSYVLTAQVPRDGRTLTVQQRVSVRAGQETRVTLALPEGVATK